MKNPSENWSSKVLAPTSFALSTIGFLIPFLGSLAGVVLGTVAKKKEHLGSQGQNIASYAVAIGIIGLVIWTVITFVIVYFRGLH